jgi:hypothetical protein
VNREENGAGEHAEKCDQRSGKGSWPPEQEASPDYRCQIGNPLEGVALQAKVGQEVSQGCRGV